MITLDNFLACFGALTMALLFLYGFKNYWLTIIAGFVAFCVFYFSYDVRFKWDIQTMLVLLKDAAIFYLTGFVLAVIIYKIFPVKNTAEVSPK